MTVVKAELQRLRSGGQTGVAGERGDVGQLRMKSGLAGLTSFSHDL